MIREEIDYASDDPMIVAWRAFGDAKEYPALLDWASGGILGSATIGHKALFAAFAEGWYRRAAEATS